MKYTTLKTVAMLSLFVMLAAGSVAAQSNTHTRVHIPFDFAAGTAKLKAGEYFVSRSAESILVLRRDDEGRDTLVFAPTIVHRPEADRSGKLVFHRYGKEYFLADVWTPANPIGRAMNPSGAERRFIRELAKTKTHPELIQIIALTR